MRAAWSLVALALALAGSPAQAAPADGGAPRVADRVGFDQRLGEQVPIDLAFRDESGAAVRLSDYLDRRRPVILALVYYDCPMLCGLSLQGIASGLRAIPWDTGREFDVVAVSFDPRDTPRQAKARKAMALDLYGRPDAAGGWHFLTGDEETIRRLTRVVGFRYAWDDEQRQFSHAAGIVVLTPAGRIARYLFGVEYPPDDLRGALGEASSGRIGTLVDRLLLLCSRYDPRTGRYATDAIFLMRAAGVVTLAALAVFLVLAGRGRRKDVVA